jgi:hypothetical protein
MTYGNKKWADCDDYTMNAKQTQTTQEKKDIGDLNAEHILEFQTFLDFWREVVGGTYTLNNWPPFKAAPANESPKQKTDREREERCEYLNGKWFGKTSTKYRDGLAGYPTYPVRTNPDRNLVAGQGITAMDWVGATFPSNGKWTEEFVGLQARLNGIKQKLFKGDDPIAIRYVVF